MLAIIPELVWAFRPKFPSHSITEFMNWPSRY
jgi:hypothetical protein